MASALSLWSMSLDGLVKTSTAQSRHALARRNGIWVRIFGNTDNIRPFYYRMKNKSTYTSKVTWSDILWRPIHDFFYRAIFYGLYGCVLVSKFTKLRKRNKVRKEGKIKEKKAKPLIRKDGSDGPYDRIEFSQKGNRAFNSCLLLLRRPPPSPPNKKT